MDNASNKLFPPLAELGKQAKAPREGKVPSHALYRTLRCPNNKSTQFLFRGKNDPLPSPSFLFLSLGRTIVIEQTIWVAPTRQARPRLGSSATFHFHLASKFHLPASNSRGNKVENWRIRRKWRQMEPVLMLCVCGGGR